MIERAVGSLLLPPLVLTALQVMLADVLRPIIVAVNLTRAESRILVDGLIAVGKLGGQKLLSLLFSRCIDVLFFKLVSVILIELYTIVVVRMIIVEGAVLVRSCLCRKGVCLVFERVRQRWILTEAVMQNDLDTAIVLVLITFWI